MSEKPKVIIIRVELDADFYERLKAEGYKLDDIRGAIREAGLSELSCLLDDREDATERRRIAHDG